MEEERKRQSSGRHGGGERGLGKRKEEKVRKKPGVVEHVQTPHSEMGTPGLSVQNQSGLHHEILLLKKK